MCVRNGGWCRRRGNCVFFFQAEDGIRDYKVTGVQTCALPILIAARRNPRTKRVCSNQHLPATSGLVPKGTGPFCLGSSFQSLIKEKTMRIIAAGCLAFVVVSLLAVTQVKGAPGEQAMPASVQMAK